MALGYSRTEGLVVGRTGPSTIDTGSLAVKHQLLRELVLDLVGSVSRFAQAGVDDTTTYTASAALSYQLTAWLVARLNYIYSRQEQGSLTIQHQIVGLSLDFSHPIRVD